MHFKLNWKLIPSILAIISQFLIEPCESNITLPQYKDNHHNFKIQQLIQHVIGLNLEHNGKILYSTTLDINDEYLNSLYKEVFNCKLLPSRPLYRNYKPIDVYVLELDTIQIIEKLQTSLEWNSRAKFIIFYAPKPKDLKLIEVFKYLANLYIYNVIVINPEGLVYTYHPFLYENWINPHLQPELITSADNYDYFPKKLPGRWRNTTVRVLAANIPPFVIDENQLIITGGSEFRMVEEILRPQMQFKSVEYIHEFHGIGGLLPNGTYTLLLGRVQRREGDFSIGGAQLLLPHATIAFDIPHPFGDDDVIWAIPTPPIRSHTMNVTRIFTPIMWAALFTTLFLGSLLWVVISTIAPGELRYFKIKWNSAAMPFKFLFCELSAHNPRALSVRMVYCCTWIFVFIMNSAWEAHLIITLTCNNRDASITGLQDVLDRNLRIALPQWHAMVYKNSGTKLGEKLYAKTTFIDPTHNSLHAEIDRAAFVKDSIALTSRRAGASLMSMGFLYERDGVPALSHIDEQIWHTNVVEYFVRGHPMFPRFNELMNWIRASGLGELYVQQWHHFNRVRVMVNSKSMFHSNSLSLEHMSAAFGLLFCGSIFGLLVFIIECYIGNKNKC